MFKIRTKLSDGEIKEVRINMSITDKRDDQSKVVSEKYQTRVRGNIPLSCFLSKSVKLEITIKFIGSLNFL